MDLKFQQSEPIAARRRWILVLVSDADATAALTGATGQVYISKNGAAGVLSTNSIVEIDAVNMPGQYYIELTAGELSDLGWISIYKKTASSKAFEDRGFVSYDDPVARHGGFAFEGGSGKGGLSKVQAKALLTDIRTIIQEELAKDEVEDDVEEKDYTEKLDAILAAVTAEAEPQLELDLSPVLQAIGNLPKPVDYSKQLAALGKQVAAAGQTYQLDMSKFETAMEDMVEEMQTVVMDDAKEDMAEMKQCMDDMQKSMDAFQTLLKDSSDMDKRFDQMVSAEHSRDMKAVVKKITDLAVQIVELKYQLKKK